METIKNYLDNMFAGMPRTARMAELKHNMLSNMEEKYNELKREGKTENEAIGIVISEFGNIDELMSELGIVQGEEGNDIPVLSAAETKEYVAAKRRAGIFIGLGVVLCILAVATLILINQLIDDGFLLANATNRDYSAVGLIPFFMLITIAVGMFIYNSMKLEKYNYIENGVQLPNAVKAEVQRTYDNFRPTFTLALIVGVGLCIMSPVALFIINTFGEAASEYGVVILLSIIACAVFIFVYFGFLHECYSRLLRIGDYAVSKSKNKEKENKVIGAVAAIVWPLAVLIFLLSGFLYSAWHIAWIVFPVTGILFGMFSAAYSIITGNNNI